MFENKEFRTTARGVVLNDRNEILLVQHDEGKNWVFPGGHVEELESPHEGLVRELKEEFQINIDFIGFSLKTEDKGIFLIPTPIDSYIVNYDHKNFGNVNRVEYIFLCKYKNGKLVSQKSEIHNYKWFSREDILNNKVKVYDRVKELCEYIKIFL